VAHAAYAVAAAARRKGVGRAMAEHSLDEARRLGYRAMQFDLVVATNPAVRLWESLGFSIVETSPQVFEHGELGPVDAYVMHRFL
jgi:ribosomal protein S18 acetylase RimI-like enzyme